MNLNYPVPIDSCAWCTELTPSKELCPLCSGCFKCCGCSDKEERQKKLGALK